jgi:hypothetical protein
VEKEHYNADGEELRRLLAVRGIIYDRLKRSSDAHNFALNEVKGHTRYLDGARHHRGLSAFHHEATSIEKSIFLRAGRGMLRYLLLFVP